MTSRRGLLRSVGIMFSGITGIFAADRCSLGESEISAESSTVVDRTKMQKKFSYSEGWLDTLERLVIEWKFVRRGDLKGLDGLFSPLPHGKEYTLRGASDLFCVIRAYRRGHVTAGFKSLALRAKPDGDNPRRFEKVFRIQNDCYATVVYSVHTLFGWGDASRPEHKMALAGKWIFEIDDVDWARTKDYD